MTTYSTSQIALISDLKAFIKSKSRKGGGLTHYHYVLYAALRGKDIRKTSHQANGENAIQCLTDMIEDTCFMRQPAFRTLKTPEGKPMFMMKDFDLLRLSLLDAKPKNH